MPRSSPVEPAPLIGARMPKVSALDGIRGLAIFAVFGYHVMPNLFPGGFLGVDMFFVLSAFLISSILMTEFRASGSSGRRGRIDFLRFYRHRFLRLAPALIVFLAVLGPLSAERSHYNLIYHSTIYSLFYVMDFAAAHVLIHAGPGATYNHLWSLSAEEQFYLVWPFVLWVSLRKLDHSWRIAMLLSLASLAVFVERLSTLHLGMVSTYFFISGHLAPLALGCLAAELAVHGMPQWMRWMFSQAALGWLAVLVIAYSLHDWPGWSLSAPDAHHLYVAPTAAFAAAVAWVILHAMSQPDNWLSRALSVSPLRWLGSRSYGFYLYHVAILFLLRPPSTGSPIRELYLAPLVFTLSAMFSEASFRWFERPIARAGRRLLDNRSRTGDSPVMAASPNGMRRDPGFAVFAGPVAAPQVAPPPVEARPVEASPGGPAARPHYEAPARLRKLASRTPSTPIRQRRMHRRPAPLAEQIWSTPVDGELVGSRR